MPTKPTTSVPDTGAPQTLDHVCGVDIVTALARFGGDEALYRRWLSDFVATADAYTEEIRNHIAAGQIDIATKIVHTRKGRVGALGMTSLHAAFSQLEQALRQGVSADAHLVSLTKSLEEMYGELEKVGITRRN
jgi:HPt (histidine-containing phosphotransfer) domain-containing protein